MSALAHLFPMNNLTKERLHGEQIETVCTLSQTRPEYFSKGRSEKNGGV